MFATLTKNLTTLFLIKAIRGKGSLVGSKVDMDKIRFCLEGYPRSANSTAVYLLKPLLQRHYGNSSVVHHTHDIRTIRLCLLHNLPCLILLRDPLSAVSSNYVYHQGRHTPEALTKKWISFYLFIEDIRKNILLCNFTTVIRDINKVIDAINVRYRLGLPFIDDVNRQLEAMRTTQQRHSEQRRGAEYFTVLPLPDVKKEARKQDIMVSMEGPVYEQALELYQRLMPDI